MRVSDLGPTVTAQHLQDALEQFGNIYPVARPRALLLKGQFQLLQDIEQQCLGAMMESLSEDGYETCAQLPSFLEPDLSTCPIVPARSEHPQIGCTFWPWAFNEY